MFTSIIFVRPRWLALACLGVVLSSGPARADDVLPRPADPKRYEKLADRSPFAPPSAAPSAVSVATPPPGPSWSDNLTVTSLMQVGNVYTATVTEKDTSLSYLIRTGVENQDHHLELSSVQWAERPEAITVTVRKGAQFGEVRFDPAAASSGGAATGAPSASMGRPVAPNPVQPFRPPPNPGILPNRPMPQPPGGIVRGRPPIRANPGAPMPGRPVNMRPNLPLRGAPGRPLKNANDDDDDN